MTALIRAEALSKHFAVRRGFFGRGARKLVAVDRVDLEVAAGECLAVVGESGSGKSTLGRLLLALLPPTTGRVLFRGEDLSTLDAGTLRRRRRQFQMIFQDPYGSLNPRLTVGSTLAEPLAVHRVVPPGARPERVRELLESVGLGPDAAGKLPHEFSGGQRQRIAIARALAPEPALIVADEPVSALDVSVRAQIINLLADLSQRLELTMLFVSHDLAVVEQLADRVAVMYLGRFVELAPARDLFARPQHPYTASLLAAVPDPVPGAARPVRLAGDPPSPVDPPSGCTFHPRCPIARPRCHLERPDLVELVPGRWVSCHYPGEVEAPVVSAGASAYDNLPAGST